MVASIPFSSDFEDPSLQEFSYVKNLNITDAWSYNGTKSLYNPQTEDSGYASLWLPRYNIYYLSAYVNWTLFSTATSEIFFVSNDLDLSLVDVEVIYITGQHYLLLHCNPPDGETEDVGTLPHEETLDWRHPIKQ